MVGGWWLLLFLLLLEDTKTKPPWKQPEIALKTRLQRPRGLVLFGCVFEKFCGKAEDLIQARYNVPSHGICVSLFFPFCIMEVQPGSRTCDFDRNAVAKMFFHFSTCFSYVLLNFLHN